MENSHAVDMERLACEDIAMAEVFCPRTQDSGGGNRDGGKKGDGDTAERDSNYKTGALMNRKSQMRKRESSFWRRMREEARLRRKQNHDRHVKAAQLWRSIVLWTCFLYLVALLVMGFALSSLPVKTVMWVYGYMEEPPIDAYETF